MFLLSLRYVRIYFEAKPRLLPISALSDTAVGENDGEGKQPFVIELENQGKPLLPEPPSEVSVAHLFLLLRAA